MAKTFKDKMQQRATNPTLQFISQPETATEPQEESQSVEESKTRESASTASGRPRKAPQARRALPQYGEEIKSRRLQLLLTPSLYEELRERAALDRMSVNELMTVALMDYLSK